MKTTIELPFFPGFYETWLESSDTGYWAIKEELDYYRDELGREDLTEDDLAFDYRKYEKDVCDAYIEEFKRLAPSFVKSVEFEELWSPKYYNFENDRLYVKIELGDEWKDDVRTFMHKEWDWLKERIHEEWSDRDGFISFMSNQIGDWSDKVLYDEDARYISSMLKYIMLVDDDEMYDHLCEAAMDDIYEGTYVYIKDNKEE